MFWYRLHLFGDVYLSTGPEAVAEGERRGTSHCGAQRQIAGQGPGCSAALRHSARLCSRHFNVA